MTVTEAQAALRSISEELLAVEVRLRRVREAVPRLPKEDEILEGEVALGPGDGATGGPGVCAVGAAPVRDPDAGEGVQDTG